MDSHTLAIVAIVIFAAVVVVGILLWRQRRSQSLRERFGPEYDRVVRQEGSQHKAENVLEYRQKRLEKVHLRPIDPSQKTAFATRWNAVQAHFVDDPPGAVREADVLLNEVMTARGYPVSDFEQRAADISVDHPGVVENYRAANKIALLHGRGQAGTEDLRKALVHYRFLFQDLLEEGTTLKKEKLA
jgi:hypothetical protein